jgi:hypothetical protein
MILIDRFDWKDVLFDNSPWSNNVSHVLRAAVTDPLDTTAMDPNGWRAIKDAKAAVWNGGFQEYLASGVDVTAIASRLG